MLTTKEVRSVLVCNKPRPGKEYTKDGLPRRGRKIGKVFKTIFDPSGMRVVGFIVRRPDLLWMFKRPEKFLALDAMDIVEGVIVPTMGADSWDDRAIKRLGVDYDTCIIWEGMPVKTTDGLELGYVDEISFDEATGELTSIFLDDGIASRALIGSVEIGDDMIVGYKKDHLEVLPEARELGLTGGLAAKAGEATAKASIAAHEGAEKAGKVASEAVDKGAVGLGKAIGRAKNMVSETRDEYRKEAGTPAKKKPASTQAKASEGSGAKASSSKSSSAKSGSTSTKAKSSTKKSATQAAADHLKSAGSMFSDFKSEFDKARKS